MKKHYFTYMTKIDVINYKIEQFKKLYHLSTKLYFIGVETFFYNIWSTILFNLQNF